MIPFKRANILLPKNIDMTKWSVVACDQYTSEMDYWNEVEKIVGSSPSTLRITLPEIFLEDSDVNERINKINDTMKEYLDEDLFYELKDSMIYLERTQADGRVREGLMGMVDLEDYSYEKGSQTLIRATEKTVIERIPPRLKVRENALLELPHIMILIDDEKKKIIEDLKNEVTDSDVVYDFDLMENGGHIKGYKLNNDSMTKVEEGLEALCDKEYFEKKYNVKDKGILLFAMGDGNHSLATAKANYENLKKTMTPDEYLNHPSRYALVELVNLHSEALEFEPIHRVIFDTDVNKLIEELYKYYDINEEGNGQYFELVTKDIDKKLYISNPKSNIAVGSIQMFLDEYLKDNKGKLDYIHGDETTKNMGMEENNVAILFEAMPKEELFRTVILDGALPRKTFSMGHSYDKRYYLEARKIK
ncbi:putative uncharacterized protein [Clostridium sp. CAG:302]|jgi:hypothetical protein|nr:putative uncharacterized protein [Clostridium sp. CAG:302]